MHHITPTDVQSKNPKNCIAYSFEKFTDNKNRKVNVWSFISSWSIYRQAYFNNGECDALSKEVAVVLNLWSAAYTKPEGMRKSNVHIPRSRWPPPIIGFTSMFHSRELRTVLVVLLVGIYT